MTPPADHLHAAPPGVHDIDVRTARERFSAGAVLLDVREPAEWAAGHIDGAMHVPLADLDPGRLPPDREVLALCRSGNRSSKAATALARHGLDVVNVAGGMQAWAAAGYPVVTDDGSPGTVA